ncbi:MAG: Chaperone protein ClpB [Chlamydiae bacterium]|nr:Chaperone protein ClpB [Chlamydiota bacterium]
MALGLVGGLDLTLGIDGASVVGMCATSKEPDRDADHEGFNIDTENLGKSLQDLVGKDLRIVPRALSKITLSDCIGSIKKLEDVTYDDSSLDALVKGSWKALNLKPVSEYADPSTIDYFAEYVITVLPNRVPDNKYDAIQSGGLWTEVASTVIVGVNKLRCNFKGGKAQLAVIIGSLAISYLGKRFISQRQKFPKELTYLDNQTLAAIRRKYTPLIKRDDIIKEVFKCWGATSRTNGRHPLLVGDSGVGKTSIMAEIARRIAFGVVPNGLRKQMLGKLVFGGNASEFLPDSAMFGGTDKIQDLVRRLNPAKENVILVLDEVHALFTDQKITQLFKSVLDPLSSKWLPYVLCATTTEEYKKYIEIDAALSRRFTKIKVPSLDSQKDVIPVLQQFIYSEFPETHISDQALIKIYEEANSLCDAFPDCIQPGISKSILSDLLVDFREHLAGLSETDQGIFEAYEREMKECREEISRVSDEINITPINTVQRDNLEVHILFLKYCKLESIKTKMDQFVEQCDLVEFDDDTISSAVEDRKSQLKDIGGSKADVKEGVA